MPCTVTAFSVKIAFPGTAAMESIIAREVMAGWNAHHALEEKRILVPLDEEEKPDPRGTDLLVSFFCDSPASGPSSSSDEAEAEIEKQLKGGKPALIYFSEARDGLAGHPMPEGHGLVDFKKRFAAAMIESYANEKELRAKISQQLEAMMCGHNYFKPAEPASTLTAQAAAPESKPDAPPSEYAQVILFEACDDFEGYIGHVKTATQLRIQANGKQLVEPQTPENIAKWDAAFHELLSNGYIRDAGFNGQLFQISAKGFAFLKTIGRNPVGYIAELGGM